jgi:hypothetical protein
MSWLLTAAASQALLAEAGDEQDNTGEPAFDVGWLDVGARGGSTAVHLGGGIVLTAGHVGAGDFVIAGRVHPVVPGSAVRLKNDDGTEADLVLFQVHPAPATDGLVLSVDPQPLGTPVWMIARGHSRGAAVTWDPSGPEPPGPYEGYGWGPRGLLRWATNHVDALPKGRIAQTRAFATRFDAGGSESEGQGSAGDSGGAVVVDTDLGPELAGILIAIEAWTSQPPATSFYSQRTYVADLAYYEEQIANLRALPEPRGGIWAATALLLFALARARSPSCASHRG